MAKYEITSPSGDLYEVEAPDDATQEQVLSYFQSQISAKTTTDEGTSFTKEIQQIGPAFMESLGRPLESMGETAEVFGFTDIAQGLKGAITEPENYESAAARFAEPKPGDASFVGFAWQYAPRAIVEKAGQIGGSILTRGAGFIAGTPLGPAGQVAGAFVGPAVFEAAQIIGPVAKERAANNGREVPNQSDIAGAIVTATGSGALNAIGAKYLPGGEKATGKFFKRLATSFLGEGPTETGSALIEQVGGTAFTEKGLEVSPKQALAEGIIGGGSAAAITAISAPLYREPKEKKIVTEEEAEEQEIEGRSNIEAINLTAPAGDIQTKKNVSRIAELEKVKAENELLYQTLEPNEPEAKRIELENAAIDKEIKRLQGSVIEGAGLTPITKAEEEAVAASKEETPASITARIEQIKVSMAGVDPTSRRYAQLQEELSTEEGKLVGVQQAELAKKIAEEEPVAPEVAPDALKPAISEAAGDQQASIKIKDNIQQKTDPQTGDKISIPVKDFTIETPQKGSAYGYILNNVANIVGIQSPKKEGSVIEPKRGTQTYLQTIQKLSEFGVTTLRVAMPSKDSQIALEKLVLDGTLSNPRDFSGPSDASYPTTWDIVSKKPSKPVTPTKTTEPPVSMVSKEIIQGVIPAPPITEQAAPAEAPAPEVVPERDVTKPEQMTPEERGAAKMQVIAVESEKGLRPRYYLAIREGENIGIYESNYSDLGGELLGSGVPVSLLARPTLSEVLKSGGVPGYIEKIERDEGSPIYRAYGIGKAKEHSAEINYAKIRSKPVSAAAVEAYGITLPAGYTKQGDLYVYQPATAVSETITEPAPAPTGIAVERDYAKGDPNTPFYFENDSWKVDMDRVPKNAEVAETSDGPSVYLKEQNGRVRVFGVSVNGFHEDLGYSNNNYLPSEYANVPRNEAANAMRGARIYESDRLDDLFFGIDQKTADKLVAKYPPTPQQKSTATPQSPTGIAVGNRIKLGRSPQAYTVEEVIPQTETEKELGEQYYSVKNEKTGEVQTVEKADIKPIKRLRKGEAGGVLIPSREDFEDLGRRIYEKGMQFKTWADRMVSEFGDAVRSFLGDIWQAVSGIPAKINELAGYLPGKGEGGSVLTPSRDKETRKQVSEARKIEQVTSDAVAALGADAKADYESFVNGGKTLEQIASAKGKSVNSVRVNVVKAEAAIKKSLAKAKLNPLDSKPENPVIEWTTKAARKYMTKEGNLPGGTFQNWVKRNARLSKEAEQVRQNIEKLYSALRDIYKINKIQFILKGLSSVPPDMVEKLNEALAKKIDINKLDKRLRGPITKLREHIDALSSELIATGQLPNYLEAKARNNLGIYLTRSYKIFSDPKWIQKIPAEKLTNARNFLYQQSVKSNPDFTIEDADRQLEQMLNDWAGEAEAKDKKRGGKLGAKDLSVMMTRSEIPKELRDVMGENNNVIFNYANTIGKISRFIADQNFLEAVKQEGAGKFVFTKDAAPAGFNTLIAAEESRTMSPLNGLRTTPEIAEAFAEFGKAYDASQNPGLHLLGWLNAVGKANLTVGSVLTQMRNLIGQPFFFVANGHTNLGVINAEVSRLMKDKKLTKEEAREELVRMAAGEGLVGENAYAGELKEAFEQVGLKTFDDMDADEFSRQFVLLRLFKSGTKGAQRLYQKTDEFGKMIGWLNETDRVMRMNKGMSREDAMSIASERVRNTYPTYSQGSQALRLFRRQPFIGPFATFFYETFRTTYWNAIYAFEDINKGGDARKEGITRLAGTMIQLSVGSLVASALSKMIAGIGDDEEEDVRRMLPPWEKDAAMIWFPKDKQGVYNYINLSYVSPYNALTDPFMAMMSGLARGEDQLKILIEATQSFLEPFVSWQPVTASIMDAARNRTETGKKVYNEEADLSTKTTDILLHVFGKTFTPGTVDRIRKRIVPAIYGETVGARAPEPVKEIASELTGIRFQNLDMKQAFQNRAWEFNKSQNESERIFRDVATRRRRVTAEEQIKAYRTAEQSRFENWQEMYRDYMAVRRAGATEDEAIELMTDIKISRREAYMIADGEYMPYQVSDEVLRRSELNGNEVPMDEIDAIAEAMPTNLQDLPKNP